MGNGFTQANPEKSGHGLGMDVDETREDFLVSNTRKNEKQKLLSVPVGVRLGTASLRVNVPYSKRSAGLWLAVTSLLFLLVETRKCQE